MPTLYGFRLPHKIVIFNDNNKIVYLIVTTFKFFGLKKIKFY